MNSNTYTYADSWRIKKVVNTNFSKSCHYIQRSIFYHLDAYQQVYYHIKLTRKIWG